MSQHGLSLADRRGQFGRVFMTCMLCVHLFVIAKGVLFPLCFLNVARPVTYFCFPPQPLNWGCLYRNLLV